MREADFTRLVTALPAVTLHEQWGSLVAKVGGKVFALVSRESDSSGAVVFKVPEDGFAMLTTQPGVGQAPYFAKRQWVQVADGAVEDEVIGAYLGASHRTVASKLTRKAQAELSLADYLARSFTA